jgi:hypothetical protein
MKILRSKAFWGLILVLMGVVLLFQSLGWFEGTDIFWMALCGAGGILFLAAFISDRSAWWLIIPAFSLIGISVALALPAFTSLPDTLTGGVLLGSIGLSFIAIYLHNRLHWWAIIPGGVLLTIGLVSYLDTTTTEYLSGGVFFVGLGLTFSLVAILPTPIGKMLWAWIPAAAMFLLAIITLAGIDYLLDYFLPAAIILAGIYFLWRAIRHR